MSPNAGGGGVCGVSASENSCAHHHVTWNPNNSIFNLWFQATLYEESQARLKLSMELDTKESEVNLIKGTVSRNEYFAKIVNK
jgi:hypothetical protein